MLLMLKVLGKERGSCRGEGIQRFYEDDLCLLHKDLFLLQKGAV